MSCTKRVMSIWTVEMPGMCSDIYDTAHYKELLKSFDKARVQSRLQASFCRDILHVCTESDVNQNSLTHISSSYVQRHQSDSRPAVLNMKYRMATSQRSSVDLHWVISECHSHLK